jgi:hypothetical protein
VQSPRPTSPTRRALALALLAFGTVVLLLGILADTIGIGTGKGFGYYQMIVVITGIALILAGLAILLQRWLSLRDDEFEPEP